MPVDGRARTVEEAVVAVVVRHVLRVVERRLAGLVREARRGARVRVELHINRDRITMRGVAQEGERAPLVAVAERRRQVARPRARGRLGEGHGLGRDRDGADVDLGDVVGAALSS